MLNIRFLASLMSDTYELNQNKSMILAENGLNQEQIKAYLDSYLPEYLNNWKTSVFGVTYNTLFSSLNYKALLPPLMVREDLFPEGWPESVEVTSNYDLPDLEEYNIPSKLSIYNSSSSTITVESPGRNYIIYFEPYQAFYAYNKTGQVDMSNFYTGMGQSGPYAGAPTQLRLTSKWRALVWYVKIN